MENWLTVFLGSAFVVGLVAIGSSNMGSASRQHDNLIANIAYDHVSHMIERSDIMETPSSTMIKIADDGRRSAIWCARDAEGHIGWRIETPGVPRSWQPSLKVVTNDNMRHDEMMTICEKAFSE